MSRKFLSVFLSLAVAAGIGAQSADPVVLSYQRNFVRASITTKLELITDASRITTVNMTPLYADALGFVRQNYPLLGNDAQLLELATGAANRVASYKDPSVIPVISSVFSEVPETRVRIACLDAFALLAAIDDSKTVKSAFLNDWFSLALDRVAERKSEDVRTMTACAGVLGRIGEGESFAVLFRAATSRIDSSVVQAATAALNMISSGYTQKILAIIETGSVKERYAAFTFAMKKENLPADERGLIAEKAFGSVSALTGDLPEGTDQLLRESMEQLTAQKWSGAASLVVSYYYRLQGDYKTGKSDQESLIPVVRCMGAMGTSETAQALSILLGLLNSETEQKKTYNEQLMLAVIQALGDLGDKTAFDYLLYVGYLDYPESVKKASRDALARLQW